MKFAIKVVEILSKIVQVDAPDLDTAMHIAEDNWKSSEDGYILSADDFDHMQLEEVNTNEEGRD